MKRARISNLFIIVLLCHATAQADAWDTIRDIWNQMRKNATYTYKKHPVATGVAVTALLASLGLLRWAIQRNQGLSVAHAAQAQSRSSRPSGPKLPLRFNVQRNLDAMTDLSGLLQEYLGEGHDWPHTAVAFGYNGIFTHLCRPVQGCMQNVELDINELVTKAGFVGICSSSPATEERLQKVAELGIPGDQQHWCLVPDNMTKFAALYECLKDKGRFDTYILVDKDQTNVKAFIEAGRKERVNTLGIYLNPGTSTE